MPDKPQVSIIIPVYNYAHYLKRTLDSVFGQIYRDYEVIVIDDGSDDDPFQAIEPYGEKVRYFRQENQGVCAARNAGLDIAEGEFIQFLDADDYIVPDKLNAQVAMMKASPTYGIVHSGWWLVDSDEIVYDCVTPWDYAPHLDLKTWLLWKPVFPSAMLLRKSVIEAVGGFDPAFTQAEDVDLVFRMMLTGCEAIWLKRPMAYYRQHPNNTIKDSLGQADNTVLLIEKFFSQKDIPKRIRNLESRVWHSSILWNCANLFEAGQLSEVKIFLRLASEKSGKNILDICLDFYQQLSKYDSRLLELEQLYKLVFELISNDENFTAWKNLDIPRRDFVTAFNTLLRVYDLATQTKAYELDIGDFPQLSTRHIIKILTMQIVGNSRWISPADLDRLWLYLRNIGLVPDEDRCEVITLFLTLFSKSMFSRKWLQAVGYFASAVSRSFHFKAFIPWYRFFLSAIDYALERFNGQRRI